MRLIFTGAPGKAELQVRKEIEKSGLEERISLMGRVSSRQMKEIFNSASIVAFPSTYEGFGIPVLEAMAAGIPVVAAEGTPVANLLGKDSIIAAQSGIAGSTIIGSNCIMGGQVGIAGHLKIGKNVTIAAKSGVTKNIHDNKTVAGFPAIDINLWKKNIIQQFKKIK